jgi:hypothetical protein
MVVPQAKSSSIASSRLVKLVGYLFSLVDFGYKMLRDRLLSRSRSLSSLIANSDYSCEAEILRRKIHLPAYYVLTALHVMCAIKLLHVVRIRVLILGGTSGALISIWQMTLAISRINTRISYMGTFKACRLVKLVGHSF